MQIEAACVLVNHTLLSSVAGATLHVRARVLATHFSTFCDACGGDLYQRADDTEATVKQGLQAYNDQTQPLIDNYNQRGIVATVLGVGDIKGIFGKVVKALDKI